MEKVVQLMNENVGVGSYRGFKSHRVQIVKVDSQQFNLADSVGVAEMDEVSVDGGWERLMGYLSLRVCKRARPFFCFLLVQSHFDEFENTTLNAKESFSEKKGRKMNGKCVKIFSQCIPNLQFFVKDKAQALKW